MKKINLSILWHFHQPSYLLYEPSKKYFFFPWVFVHAIREYYDMGKILLSAPPEVKVSFNITPTLWLQIKEYLKEDFSDKWIEIFKKNPSFMENEEKIFVLRNFFSVNYEKQIFPYERYKFLFMKRGGVLGLEEKIKYFSDNELRDIQFYFIYSNISEIKKEENEILKEMGKKRENYTEEDKEEILKICFEIIKETEEIYKNLIKLKKIELTTTPFSHPIMPLIINSSVFFESSPHLKDKGVQFSYPEDAEKQIDFALDFMKKEFDYDIKGIWPSEGGVSDDTLSIFIKKGILFTMTDEGILERSLNIPLREKEFVKKELYKPYIYENEKGEIVLFFRDREISDRIGFVYKNLKPEIALSNFIDYIKRLRDLNEDLWISIILDGENPWVHYEKGGIIFLKKLYESLSKLDFLKFSFFEEGISFKNKGNLKKIHPGSWIKSDFTTWMGDEEKNEGWKVLKRVREDLKDEVFKNEKSLFSLLFAEGSDFFWWLGYDNPTFYAPEFDILFREHLKNVYKNLKKEYPVFLEEPVKKIIHKNFLKLPSGYVYPVIDGRITNFYEWANAGIINLYRSEKDVIKFIYFGWDEKGDFCLRIDGIKSFKELFEEGFIIFICFKTDERERIYKFDKKEKPEGIDFKIDKIFEMKLKIEDIIYLFLVIENKIILRYPEYGYYLIEKKEKDFNFI